MDQFSRKGRATSSSTLFFLEKMEAARTRTVLGTPPGVIGSQGRSRRPDKRRDGRKGERDLAVQHDERRRMPSRHEWDRRRNKMAYLVI